MEKQAESGGTNVITRQCGKSWPEIAKTRSFGLTKGKSTSSNEILTAEHDYEINKLF